MVIMSFTVSDFGTNRKLIGNFLVVNNTNLYPISNRFQVIAGYWLNFTFNRGYLSLTYSFGEPLNSGVQYLASEN